MHSQRKPPFDGSPIPELISVTSETVDALFPELPRLVRLALGFGSKLQHGTLDVTLADGRSWAVTVPDRPRP
jgi:cyclopropane-fatty-acyl-phospholipid synthase